jgi:hypothetical protein
MGTIRKISGEFFYRKDGVSYKFFNQSFVKSGYPYNSDPITIEDNQVRFVKLDDGTIQVELTPQK